MRLFYCKLNVEVSFLYNLMVEHLYEFIKSVKCFYGVYLMLLFNDEIINNK